MTTLTLARLLGTPGYGNDFDLDGAIEVCKKATGGGSAIGIGRITILTESTGTWAIATSGSTGRMGVVPKLYPQNTDSDATFGNVTRSGAEIYIEANATIQVGQRVAPDTGGKGKAYAAGDVTATPTESTIESAIKDFERAPFAYLGHYGEGSGLTAPTNGLTGEAIRVRHL